jgi:N6-L-threonylcarbamoyladenine synthase
MILGIDTSNYTTSVAVASADAVVCDRRKMLEVKQGMRGLRQSEAFYQHTNNLPQLLSACFKEPIDGYAFLPGRGVWKVRICRVSRLEWHLHR